ncbi:putative protein kinase-like domain [Rosellinia necatrix]|uniref:Uncharacterized protein n=1 Tax=Rosellinia necatrix TaxID=77044 RepID=A0A1W2TH15_ROSNE|nr:putative protein kinase-like domain [Rosellinia necatrix]
MGYFKIQCPIPTSLQNPAILEAPDPETGESKYVTFYHITSNDDLYFGQLYKQKRAISFAEYSLALGHVRDEEVYPLVPEGTRLKVAPGHWDDTAAFIKRPGGWIELLRNYAGL